MYRVGATLADGVENRFGIQVALCGSLTAERISLVGESHMKRVSVEFGVHGDRRNAHLAGRADDANCDFAAISNENLAEHDDLSCVGNEHAEA